MFSLYFGSYFGGYLGPVGALEAPPEPAVPVRTGVPIGARPIASAMLPPEVTVSPFIALQDQAVIDVVTLVILRPFTKEVAAA